MVGWLDGWMVGWWDLKFACTIGQYIEVGLDKEINLVKSCYCVEIQFITLYIFFISSFSSFLLILICG